MAGVLGERGDEPRLLPSLRQDLRLAEGAPEPGGSPTWTIYDPSTHRYLRIGWLEFEILSRWDLRDPGAVAASIRDDTTMNPSETDVEAFAAFAARAGLVRPAGAPGTAALASRLNSGRHGPGTWLLHNYLFLRLRVVDPDRFLSNMLPWVEPMFSRGFLIVLVMAASLGLFLVGRQWDAYSSGLADLASMRGLAGIAVALSCSKLLHELGHGFAARRLGCRVPAMGVAFLVMAPVLWTDVTDAWKLPRRRDRLVVDAAGVLAEVSLAATATLAWAILPDGPARGAALVLSGSTWILTLLVNLNPLMRFDGYYLLSDLLDVPNLQERGFAMARWRLREALFRPRQAPPERMQADVRLPVLAWAYCTWIYRFSLFLGIALLVYHMAFKALGFFLMGVELWFFLARPMLRELNAWRTTVTSTGMNRHSGTTLAVLACAFGLAVVPWQGHVHAPAVRRAARQVALYVDQPGRLTTVTTEGRHIARGDVAFRLESVSVDHDLSLARARLAGLDASTRGQVFDGDRADNINVDVGQRQKAAAELADAEERQAQLSVRAPFAGTVVDIPPGTRPGLDLPRREALGMLVDQSAVLVEAYVGEADLHRLHVGSSARFLPDDGETGFGTVVTSIAPSSTQVLDATELASASGGGVATRAGKNGDTLPEVSVYKVLLTPIDGPAPDGSRRQRGTVSIQAERASLVDRVWRNAIAVAVRETGL